MTLQYSKVSPDTLPFMWSFIRPLVESYLAHSCVSSPDVVYGQLMTQEHALWVCHDKDNHDDVHSIAVTRFARYPTGLFLCVDGCAVVPGKNYDFEYMFSFLQEYARSAKCVGYEVMGRTGWQRKLPHMNMEGVVLRTMFDEQ